MREEHLDLFRSFIEMSYWLVFAMSRATWRASSCSSRVMDRKSMFGQQRDFDGQAWQVSFRPRYLATPSPVGPRFGSHPHLEDLLSDLPPEGPLFPDLSVNAVTKRFSDLREKLQLERPGLVFHSTRKWFITQCERTGVPEHFTASLVGHKSARSENGITYGIYSAGISDEQKRGIVDQIRLPSCR